MSKAAPSIAYSIRLCFLGIPYGVRVKAQVPQLIEAPAFRPPTLLAPSGPEVEYAWAEKTHEAAFKVVAAQTT